MTTRSELVNMAAANPLKVLAVGQTLSTEDYEAIDKYLDPLLAQLSAEGIVYVGDASEIPEALTIPLAWLLGNVAANEFGKPSDQAKKDEMEDSLRTMALRAAPVNTMLQADSALLSNNASGLSLARWARG